MPIPRVQEYLHPGLYCSGLPRQGATGGGRSLEGDGGFARLFTRKPEFLGGRASFCAECQAAESKDGRSLLLDYHHWPGEDGAEGLSRRPLY